MIAPASAQVAERFGITNDVTIALVTSIFVLAYGERFLNMFRMVLIKSRAC
jgi:hypothetical protein